MLIQVFDCRERSEGSMGPGRAESAGRWRGDQGAGASYCKGDSELNPDREEPGERGSRAWSLGCSAGEGEGGRGMVQRRKRKASYCPFLPTGPCVCGGGPGAHLRCRNVCRTAPRLRPSYRREAGGRCGAWSHTCRGDGRGKRTHWMTGSFGGGSGAGGRDTPTGSLIWGWRKGRGCRSCSCFRPGGIHLGSLDSRGPCINPAWGKEGRHPWEGWSSGVFLGHPYFPRWGSTLSGPAQEQTEMGSLRRPPLQIRGSPY